MKKQSTANKKNTVFSKQTPGNTSIANKESTKDKKDQDSAKTPIDQEPEIKGKDVDLMNYTDL